MSIKIKQKIGMNEFKNLSAQIKAEGIHIIHEATFKEGKVTQTDIRGQVKSAFNLGAKIEVDVLTPYSCNGARFEKLQGGYYLVVQ